MKYTCINTAYADSINKFIRTTDFVAPIKKGNVKVNLKPWLDTEIISAIRKDINYNIQSTNIQALKGTKISLTAKLFHYKDAAQENKLLEEKLAQITRSLKKLKKTFNYLALSSKS